MKAIAITLAALVVAAAAASTSAAPLLQDALDAGWESRWTHSSDAKYTGRFTSADKGAGVQVREREREKGKKRKRRRKRRRAPSI